MTHGDWSAEPAPPALTPPTEFGGVPPEPSKWPKVIGIIGIVLAALGVVCGGCGVISTPLQRWALDMSRQSGQVDPVQQVQVETMEQFQVIMIVLTIVSMLGAVWLLAASIKLLRLRADARKWFVGWAFFSLFMLVVNLGFQYLIYQAMVDALQQKGEGARAGQIWFGAAIGGCIAVVLGAAFPIFLLAWFSRSKIKAEMQQWT